MTMAQKLKAILLASHLSEAEEVEKGGPGPSTDFPDGGGRAWAVAIGASAVLFCTLGYVNSFGYARPT